MIVGVFGYHLDPLTKATTVCITYFSLIYQTDQPHVEQKPCSQGAQLV